MVGLHAGNITLKVANDIQNFACLGIFTGTSLIGMTHRYQAGNNFINANRIDSDAGFGSLTTPTHGGVITIQAANIISNLSDAFPDEAITATGKSLQGYGGLINLKAASFDIPSNDSIQANGTVQNGTIIR